MFILLGEVKKGDDKTGESYWIDYYRKQGHQLFNRQIGSIEVNGNDRIIIIHLLDQCVPGAVLARQFKLTYWQVLKMKLGLNLARSK